MSLFQRIIRFVFAFISPVLPKLAGKMAFELFQHPHAKKTRTRELAMYENCREKRIPFQSEDLYVYEMGDPDHYPIVLVHGWESNPGSMYGIAERLVKNGFHTRIIGLPAHGKAKKSKTTMVEAAECIRLYFEHEKLEKRFSLITHSFASGASSLGLMNTVIHPDKVIFLTTPDRIWDIFYNFKSMIKLGDKAFDDLIRRVEGFTPVKIDDFNISDFVQHLNYGELIIFHDKNDKVLPFRNAEAITSKNPEIELIALENKGHYRLLWDEEIIDMILNKIQQTTS